MKNKIIKDPYLRTFPVMKLCNNIYKIKELDFKLRILLAVLSLIIILSIPILMSSFIKEVDPGSLFVGVFAGMFYSYPSKYTEPNYRRYLIKHLMKGNKK